MSLGAAAVLGERALAITAIDRDVEALQIAERALARFAPHAAVTTCAADVASAPFPAADLVVIGSVLNELPAGARVAIVERALAAIGDDGAVIVIEPALRETARSLHEVRDAMLVAGRAFVFAPCTRTCAPCPALADPDDWCHEHRTLALPPRAAELARTTHLRDSGLKFAYLVLRRTELPLVATPGAWRVVGAPHAAKGKLEAYGCGDGGRVSIRLLRRHRSAINRAFADVRRGDVLVTPAEPAGARVELLSETAIALVVPAGR
jgi:hypothetical protein